MSLIYEMLVQIQELEPNTVLLMAGIVFLGLLLTLFATVKLIRGKIFTAGLHGISGLLLICMAILFLAITLNIHTYQRLTHEQEVAILNFQQLAPHKFSALIKYHDKDKQDEFLLDGDEWQIDARILKWSTTAQLFGLNAQYRLERLSGRYHNLELEKTSARTVYSLSESAGLDIWSLANRFNKWLPWVDAYYGNAIYLPMINDGSFTVSINQNGIIARPANLPTKKVLQTWK